jgi:hypothetical protein
MKEKMYIESTESKKKKENNNGPSSVECGGVE